MQISEAPKQSAALFTLVPLSFLAETPTLPHTERRKQRRVKERREKKTTNQKSTFFGFQGANLEFQIQADTHREPDQNGTPDATQQPAGHSTVPGTQHKGE